MSKISIDLEANIRNALVQAIVTEPAATIADLLALTNGEHGPLLRPITLGDLVDAVPGAKRRRKPVKPATPAKSTTPSEPTKKTANTRTAEGRAEYDKAILAALKDLGGGPVSGADVRAKTGGSALQARTSLNRLIEAGEVTFVGKARGTKYSLAK